MGDANAIEQILRDPRFEGAMDSIKGITSFLDTKFAMFISLIAFFIISAALLRNVIAGAYAAFPKFWDTIAEAKQSMASKNLNIGGTDVSFLMKIAAFFIPDIRTISDFHDNNIEPKDYFIKAIPKMVATVMIGVVIFNGYYRDAVARTSEVGSAIITRVLDVDPVAAMDRFLETAGSNPSFATEGDESTLGSYTYKVTKDAYNKVFTTFFDVKDEQIKARVSSQVESWVTAELSKYPEYFDGVNWKISYTVDYVVGDPDIKNVSLGDNEKRKSIGFKLDMTTLDLKSVKVADADKYVRVIMRFDKLVAKEAAGLSLSNLQLSIPKASISTIKESGLDKTKIVLPPTTGNNGIWYKTLKIGGFEGKATQGTNGNIEIVMDGKFGNVNVGATYKVETNFLYYAVDAKGQRMKHTITGIKIISGSKPMLEDVGNANVAAFEWDKAPVATASK